MVTGNCQQQTACQTVDLGAEGLDDFEDVECWGGHDDAGDNDAAPHERVERQDDVLE